MPRSERSRRTPTPLLCAGLALLACGPEPAPPDAAFLAARGRAAPAEREWRTVLGDPGASHFSPLAQIHRGNVEHLEPAWTYDSRDAADGGASQIQCNPIVVKGVLYGTSPSLRLFALDAATGEELWSFRPDGSGSWTAANPNRGVAYWADGDDERILYTAWRHLYAVDARTGRPLRSFGENGRVDLRAGLGERAMDEAVVATSPGAIYRDLLILGSRVSEFSGAAPGHVRAYDVRTGEIRWTFRTIPHPGEVGHDTWPPDAWTRSGGANAWAGISLDVERGLAFVPTGSPSFDFHGGDRVGDNLFANSLVALDARTGERRWHFQVVRHDVWDRDLPAPPNLVSLDRQGTRVPAVAQVTKTGHVFVFHRETGESLFPIEEVAVPGPGLPGEVLAASQPLPTRPPPFTAQHLAHDTLTERTPQGRKAVAKRLRALRSGHLFAPPSLEGTVLFPGADGGAEWGGAAYDAETGFLYVNANEVPYVIQVARVPRDMDPAFSAHAGYLMACAGCHGTDRRGDGVSVPSLVDLGDRMGPLDAYRAVRDGRGRMSGFPQLRWYEIAGLLWYVYTAEDEATVPTRSPRDGSGGEDESVFLNAGWQRFVDPDGFPASRPPWGTLTALDLARGEIAWRIPLGDYPRIRAQGLRGLGAENYGGPIVTAGGLLFIAATPDERLRALDKQTGELLWEAELPAAGFATPTTYETGGRQYLVIAAGGGKLDRPSGSHYVAFALPPDALPAEQRARPGPR